MDNEKVPKISVKIKKESRNLKNINTEQFKAELKNELENIQENVNIEEMYGNYLNNYYRKTCPYIGKEMYKETKQSLVQ